MYVEEDGSLSPECDEATGDKQHMLNFMQIRKYLRQEH